MTTRRDFLALGGMATAALSADPVGPWTDERIQARSKELADRILHACGVLS